MSEQTTSAQGASGGRVRRITIDPITRLEGHGKIDIFLDGQGEVERAFFQIPELRGFEKFAVGRPAEDMPQITSRICGVCPTAHHMAATKALDALYKVTPPRAAKKIRELVYSTFMVEDHALHIYYLGGPDFIVGPKAPAAERNVLGVIAKVGLETGRRVIETRRRLRNLISLAGGKVGHPVLGLPEGVAKRLSADDQAEFIAVANEAVEFAKFTLSVFEQIVLKNQEYVDLVLSDTYTHRTLCMGMVDERNRVNFYDGRIRVVGPDGVERAKFEPAQYLDYVAEHVEPWSYVKFAYFKPAGWKGFVEGNDSGVYSVAPLARLNVADGMATPVAQAGAAAAEALALIDAGHIELEPNTAFVEAEHCCGCKTCIPMCPYTAISFVAERDQVVVNKAEINEALCKGCGTCVAACPSGTIRQNLFEDDQIFEEIAGLLEPAR